MDCWWGSGALDIGPCLASAVDSFVVVSSHKNFTTLAPQLGLVLIERSSVVREMAALDNCDSCEARRELELSWRVAESPIRCSARLPIANATK